MGNDDRRFTFTGWFRSSEAIAISVLSLPPSSGDRVVHDLDGH